MKMKGIPIIVGALGTIPKGLIKGLEDMEIKGQVEINYTTALFRSARVLRRILETCGDLHPLKLQWKHIS